MRLRHLVSWVLVLCICGAVLAGEQRPPVRLSAGDYAAALSEKGLAITHKGAPISLGSYFVVFGPEYKTSCISLEACWQKGTVKLSGDGRTVTLEATVPKARGSYTVVVSEKGVRITASVALPEDAAVGPVEYPVVQFPPDLAQVGVIDLHNTAGMTVASVPVPATPRRGYFASQRGDVLVLRTPQRNVWVSAAAGADIGPFDARVPQYGSRQGIWAFSSIPVGAGQESSTVMEVSVTPPDPVPVPGTIMLAPGTPAVSVATAPDATVREKLAADELVAYLAKISGRMLDRAEIGDNRVPQGVIAVGALARSAGLVSQAELDAVGQDGYVVKIAQGNGAVCGGRDVGTVYGAYELLRQVGVRFYAPDCEIVPQVRDLTIPACEVRRTPAYEFRCMTGDLKQGHTPKDDMGSPHEIGEPGNIVHASAYLVPYEKYAETHPEYFALQKDGKRLHGDPKAEGFSIHLCLSNPEVRRISAERMLALIEKQPDRTFFGVSQGDGFAWCQCDRCKALDAVPGVNMTDRLLDYVNYVAGAVAAKYPDKRIVTLAYTNATSPAPTRILPAPNVMVQYCPYPPRTACQSHDLTCEKNRQGLEDLEGWLVKCPNNMYIFDYPCGYAVWYEPFGSFYAMKRKLDFYAANGVRGIFYCGVPQNFRSLFVFVQSRLLWEPKADVEAAIQEFMNAYYGKAAPYVRQYFDLMYHEVETRPVHQMCEGPNPGLLTAELAGKALDLFRQAEAAVEEDRAALYRVRREKLCVLFADLNERNLANGKLTISRDEFAQRAAEFMKIGRDLKVGAIIRRQKTGAEWLQRIARIRLQAKPWYADPLVGRMIADPAKTLAEAGQQFCQKAIPGGLLLELDGFTGCRGPEEYGYECPPKRAVWIYGKNTKNPKMFIGFHLAKTPETPARLALLAQDDDKPGAVEISIALNGSEIFRGPNPFAERGWSTAEFPIPAGVLKQGENELCIATLKDSPAADAGWFMVAECKVAWK